MRVAVLTLLALVPLISAYRVIQDDYGHNGEETVSYFEPYHPGTIFSQLP